MMRAIIQHQCLPPDPDASYEAEDIHIVIDIPFLPQPGMHLKVTPQGDYLTVRDVLWTINAPVWLNVGTEEPEVLYPWADLKDQGWQLGYGENDPERMVIL